MYAKKLNKVYTISTLEEKNSYLAQGYDIYDEQGNIIKHNPAKTIAYSEYERLLQENRELRARLEGGAPAGENETADPLAAMTVEDLKRYAKDNNINIGSSTSQGGILKKIREALAAGEGGADPKAEAAVQQPATLHGADDEAPKMGGSNASITVSSGQSQA